MEKIRAKKKGEREKSERPFIKKAFSNRFCWLNHMDHPSFSQRQTLPSLKITKECLESLESYLVGWVVDNRISSVEEAAKSLSLEIEDKNGVEKFSAMSQVPFSRFHDSTSRIQILMKKPFTHDGTELRVRLDFSGRPRFSELQIDATMPNAKDRALALKGGLLRVLEQQKTQNWIAHPNSATSTILYSTVLLISFFQLKGISNATISLFLWVISAVLFVYLFLVPQLRRYTVFDSSAADKADDRWKWLIRSIVGVLLFSSFLPWLLSRLAGS